MSITTFIKKLATTQTNDNLYNPYNELTQKLDDRTAPGVRQQNLRLYLKSNLKQKTKNLWVYFAPTYLEATRSGVPLTNSAIFSDIEDSLETKMKFEKATKTKKVPNNTTLSTSLWNVANELDLFPLIWPVVPFYAHKRDVFKSKRKFTKEEIMEHSWFLKKIIKIYKPKKILVIGKDAKDSLDLLGIDAEFVEHPRSGKDVFKASVLKLN